MIIQGNNHTIERSGGVNENKFTIEANGKAFRVLSDSLYPDKPKAILRELSCNAYDAHIAAGKQDVPFDVHLPTTLEPWLTIRDYGIGLTPEEVGGYWKEVTNGNGQVEKVFVGGVYNTFFKSTKTTSNDYIGALGLGSKSPFSYVDSFTVISRKDGMKYSFTAYINEQDEPEIVELGREPTDEGNGLEVSMPVKQQDFHQFADKARVVLQWFDPLPNVTGARGFEVEKLESKVAGTNWSMQANRAYGYYSAVAIQGKVSYPIDMQAFYHQTTAEQRTVLGGPFVLHFDIGSLDVTASRETLSYKGPTIENILKAADRVIEELPQKFQSAFDNCTTLWEARVELRKLLDNNRVLYDLLTSKKVSLKWKNYELKANENYFSVDPAKYPSVVISCFAYRNTRTILGNMREKLTFSPHATDELFRDDIKRGGFTRTRTYHKARKNSTHYHYHYDNTYLISGDSAEIDGFLKELGDPEVKLASSLPAPVRAARVVRSSVQVMETFGDKVRFVDVDTEDFDLDDGGFYVPLMRGRPAKGENGDERDETFDVMIKYATSLGILKSDEEVFGVTKASIKKFENHEDWINITDVIKERFAKYLLKNDLSETMAARYSLSKWENTFYYESRWLPRVAQNKSILGDDHALVVFSAQLTKARNADTVVPQALANALGLTVEEKGEAAYDFTPNWKILMTKYPMLRITNPSSSNDMNAVLQYIQLIDTVGAVTKA